MDVHKRASRCLFDTRSLRQIAFNIFARVAASVEIFSVSEFISPLSLGVYLT